jgi:transcriptional regulator with XRE-family HTH domain
VSEWSDYVRRTQGAVSQTEAAALTGLSQATISRWGRGGRPGTPAMVAAFARGFGVSVVEAFVAADFLTPEEAGLSNRRG